MREEKKVAWGQCPPPPSPPPPGQRKGGRYRGGERCWIFSGQIDEQGRGRSGAGGGHGNDGEMIYPAFIMVSSVRPPFFHPTPPLRPRRLMNGSNWGDLIDLSSSFIFTFASVSVCVCATGCCAGVAHHNRLLFDRAPTALSTLGFWVFFFFM